MTHATSPVFTHRDAWSGGAYELAVELGPADDARLEQALVAVWSQPELEGGYLDHDREPSEQARVAPTGSLGLETRLYGLARLGARPPVACSTYVLREDGGSDWLYLGLPLGSLGTVLPIGAFPFDDGLDLSWRSKVDGWLRGVAERVFASVGFRRGLVGWIDEELDAPEGRAPADVLDERWFGYLVPAGASLAWYPPNQGAPMRVP